MTKVVFKKNIASKSEITGKVNEAKEFYNKGKYTKAAKIFIDILKFRYNPEIACYLGKCYLYGRGVERNTNAALKLFTTASNRKYCPAYYCLAKYHEIIEMGYFSDAIKNLNMASFIGKKSNIMTLLKKSAAKGHVESCYKLGQCYTYSPHFDLNPLSKNLKWYIYAANKGHVKAMYDLGWCYQNGKLFNMEKDYVKAAFWYKKAAEMGFVKAMIDLSWCYRRGKGVKKDSKKAAYWLKKAKANKTAFNKNRILNYGDIIINKRTGEKEMILLTCTGNKDISCAKGTNCIENGCVVSEFGNHTYAKGRECFGSGNCYAKISDIKAFGDKFPQNLWKLKL